MKQRFIRLCPSELAEETDLLVLYLCTSPERKLIYEVTKSPEQVLPLFLKYTTYTEKPKLKSVALDKALNKTAILNYSYSVHYNECLQVQSVLNCD